MRHKPALMTAKHANRRRGQMAHHHVGIALVGVEDEFRAQSLGGAATEPERVEIMAMHHIRAKRQQTLHREPPESPKEESLRQASPVRGVEMDGEEFDLLRLVFVRGRADRVNIGLSLLLNTSFETGDRRGSAGAVCVRLTGQTAPSHLCPLIADPSDDSYAVTAVSGQAVGLHAYARIVYGGVGHDHADVDLFGFRHASMVTQPPR